MAKRAEENARNLGPGQGATVLAGPSIELPDASAVKRAVLTRLRRAITVGEMPAGSRLLQTQIASALGVSRMPVRDAISDLVAEGLALPAAGGGAVVSPLSKQDMHDVYAVRSTLEVFAVRTLSETIDHAQLGQLRDIVDRSPGLIEADQREALTALDKEFHWALYRATGNRFLETAMTPMWAQVDRIMYAILQLQDYMSVVWDEHARIIDALQDNDADAAAQRMEQHLQQASQRLIQQGD